ncbi:MAG: YfhO family protein [Chloroflexi bacterium]|nr:YfhO family protein [Chloroflexota bacterium]
MNKRIISFSGSKIAQRPRFGLGLRLTGVQAEQKLALLSLVLLGLLPLLFLWRVAFLGHVLISLDMLLTYEPWRSEVPGATATPLWNELAADTVRNYYPVALYITETWRKGEIPFWYPYAANNLPLLGAGFFQAFYPINVILWLIMPVHIAFGWSAILHLFLGSLFTFFFVRELGAGHFGRLLAAIAFTYCGSLVIWLGVSSVVDSMVWLPLLFWGGEAALVRRDWRWLVVGALGGALLILGGHIQLALYGFTGFGLYSLCRLGLVWLEQRRLFHLVRPLIYTILILALSCGLAAYQLLPTLELLPLITRSDIEFELQTPLQNLLRLLIPDALGVHMDGEVMPSFRQEAYLYLGLLPLFFMVAALFSPRRGVAGSLVGVGLLFLLAIYNVPPFFQLFYYFYPTFQSLGFQRAMFVVTFMWAAAAGLGADWVLLACPPRVLRGLVSGGLVLGALVVAYLLQLSFIAKYKARHFWPLPAIPEIKPDLPYHLATLFFFLVLLAAIIFLLWQWSHHRLRSSLFVSLSLLVLILDLFLTHIDQTPALPPAMLYPVTSSLKWLQAQTAKETEPYRILGAGRVLWPGTAGAFNLPSVAAYTSFPLKRYDEYAEASGVRAESNFRMVTYRPQPSPLLDALNVKYVYATRSELTGNGWLSLIEDVGRPQVTSEQAGAGQVAFWNINNWTQPVLQAPSPTLITFQGLLPKNVTLETGIAIHPDYRHGPGVLFEIYTGTPDVPLQNRVFSQVLQPNDHADPPGWLPVTLTLAGNPQRPTLVSFVTQPQGSEPTLAGWANPLLRMGDDLKLLYYGPNSIYLNQNYLPRAWVVHQANEVTLGDTTAVAQRLQSPQFDPTVAAIVEGELPAPLGPANPQDTVSVQTYRASDIVLKTNLTEPGLVIVSDSYYPGWKAYVDNVEQPIYPTNLVMRGVFVEGGQHLLHFSYDPLSFKFCSLISLGCLVAVLVGLGLDAAYRRRLFRSLEDQQ